MESKKESPRQSNFFDTCTKCKTNYSCCHDTTPPVTRQRRKIIEAYLVAENIHVQTPFAETDYVFPRLRTGGYCIFHDRKTKKCAIHAVKPETCVAGPITFDLNRKTGKIEWFIKMDRICPLAGVVHMDKELLRRHLQVAKKEITRLVKDLDAAELEAILKTEEPETIKIDQDDMETRSRTRHNGTSQSH